MKLQRKENTARGSTTDSLVEDRDAEQHTQRSRWKFWCLPSPSMRRANSCKKSQSLNSSRDIDSNTTGVSSVAETLEPSRYSKENKESTSDNKLTVRISREASFTSDSFCTCADDSLFSNDRRLDLTCPSDDSLMSAELYDVMPDGTETQGGQTASNFEGPQSRLVSVSTTSTGNENEDQQYLMSTRDQILEYCEQSRLLAANQSTRELELHVGKARKDWKTLPGNSLKKLLDASTFCEIDDTLKRMQTFYHAMSEKSGYQKNSQEPFQTFYRKLPRSQTHNIRAIANFAYPTVEVLALAREFDLIMSWNWTVQKSQILRTYSDMDIVVGVVVKMPWPYHNRSAVLRAKGVDCLDENKCAVVTFHSCDEGFGKPEAEDVKVLEGSGVMLEPCWMKENGAVVEGCRVTVQLNVDPLMKVVPPVIINFVLKVVSPVIYRLAKYVLGNYVHKQGSQLNERMKERAGFYDQVSDRVKSFLATKSKGEHL